MTTAEQTINSLLAQLTATVRAEDDATERARLATIALNGITKTDTGVQADLKAIRHTAVQQLRAAGASHADVAAALGVTRARAQQIAAGESASGRRPKTG